MAPTNDPRKRPVVGSRNPTARPRKVASGVPVPPDARVPAPAPPPTPAPTAAPAPPSTTPGLLGGFRTTAALVVAIVLLAAVVLGESWYLWGRSEPTVSASHPVITGEMAHRAAVEAASQDAEDILSTSYKNYDEQVAQATSEMTDGFAKEYRQTVGQIKGDFVAAKTELQVKVVAAGVVRASSEQVQALLFLNQYVTKPGHKTAFTPYRALVTVVHTAHGWLVDDIQTQ